MEEVGSNNDGVRKLIRELLKKATQVYPTSKIFSFLLDAAHVTRNQRSRAECLSEMTALVDRLGLDQVTNFRPEFPVERQIRKSFEFFD